jgi:hypothetical protein
MFMSAGDGSQDPISDMKPMKSMILRTSLLTADN